MSGSFEPRIGTAQFVFFIIYSLITLTALALAAYAYSAAQDYYLQLFMALIFAIMALKSFIIYKRVQKLLRTGTRMLGKLIYCEPVRGITIMRAEAQIPDHGAITIETRLAGESPAHEIKRYLSDHKQTEVPVLIVGAAGKHPRGLILVRTRAGHLDEATIKLD